MTTRRTQNIAAAVWAELGKRRRYIDAEDDLAAVTVVVSLRRDGAVRSVVFRTESRSSGECAPGAGGDAT